MTARGMCSTLLLALALAAGTAHVACAADQTILGDTLQVKNPSTADKRKVVGKAKEKGSPDTLVGDPTTSGSGAILTITANGDTPSSQTFSLPQGTSPITSKPFWSGDAVKGFKYKDSKGENGPIKTAQIKKSGSGVFVIKAVASGKLGAITVLPPNPGTDGCLLLEITDGNSYSVKFADGTITNPTRGPSSTSTRSRRARGRASRRRPRPARPRPARPRPARPPRPPRARR